MIPFQAPERQNRGLAPALAARANEWLSSPEQTVRAERELLEKALAGPSGFTHAVAVSSGFEALLISLQCLRLPAGSEVVVTSPAALEAVQSSGLKAIAGEFALPLSAAELGKLLTSSTRAVIVASPFGRQGELEAIRKLCVSKGLYWIEESAPGFANRKPSSAVYSFSPRSVLTLPGNLGALLTDDPVLATRAREARAGRQSSPDFWSLALLRAKLPRLASFLSLRRSIAQWYLAALETQFVRGTLTLPEWPKDPTTHVWEQFAVGVTDPSRLREALLKGGVETSVPLPGKPYLSLPLYPELSGKEVQHIADRVIALMPSPTRRGAPRVEIPDKTL